MAVIKCKMCGGDLTLTEGKTVAECEYCGTLQTVPVADDEKKLTLFARANRLRSACEFDKASGIYESIVADFPEEAEAYWGLVLCKFGIEYVDDPATAKKIPTCHRSSFESIMDDSDFEQALENADSVARKVYRDEAKVIEEIRKGIIAVSSNEEPYDIFICYKETAEDGQRTLDSVLAQDLYDDLTDKGYRVFFARITLEDKLGQEYEPYIFAALNSAKIMLAIGTDYEYYNAVWVKNEWSRYLKLMAKDKEKHLIPCYKGIDAYDMPKEFNKLQAQDLGKVGATQDLLRGIAKILPKQNETVKETVVVQQVSGNSQTAPLLERAFMFLEDGNWDSANEYCEKVLDIDPKNAKAYLGKLMAELRVKKQEKLVDCPKSFEDNQNFEKILRFADEGLKNCLLDDCRQITARNTEKAYQVAIQKYETAKCTEDIDIAMNMFKLLKDYKQSKEYVSKCLEEGSTSLIYNKAKEAMEKASFAGRLIEIAERFESISWYKDAAELALQCREKSQDCEKNAIYMVAKDQLQSAKLATLEMAYKNLQSISGFQDADSLMEECQEKIERIKRKESYKQHLIKKENELLDELHRLDNMIFAGKRKAELQTEIYALKEELKKIDSTN